MGPKARGKKLACFFFFLLEKGSCLLVLSPLFLPRKEAAALGLAPMACVGVVLGLVGAGCHRPEMHVMSSCSFRQHFMQNIPAKAPNQEEEGEEEEVIIMLVKGGRRKPNVMDVEKESETKKGQE